MHTHTHTHTHVFSTVLIKAKNLKSIIIYYRISLRVYHVILLKNMLSYSKTSECIFLYTSIYISEIPLYNLKLKMPSFSLNILCFYIIAQHGFGIFGEPAGISIDFHFCFNLFKS
jgi:hypothetical protein